MMIHFKVLSYDIAHSHNLDYIKRTFLRRSVRAPKSKPRERPLAVGDVISLAVRHFGEEYARTRDSRRWASDHVRDEGVVEERKHGNVKVKFKDGESHWFARKLLLIVSRCSESQSAAPHRIVVAEDSSNDSHEELEGSSSCG